MTTTMLRWKRVAAGLYQGHADSLCWTYEIRFVPGEGYPGAWMLHYPGADGEPMPAADDVYATLRAAKADAEHHCKENAQ